MKLRILILTIITLLIVVGVSFAQDKLESETAVIHTTSAPKNNIAVQNAETIPCPEGIPLGLYEVEGETAACGTVSVPVNYDESDDKQIELTYGILKSTSLAPAEDPVIYMHGGPGAAELGLLAQDLAEKFATLRQRRDIIVFDERGSGYSPGEVDCSPAYESVSDAIFEEAQSEVEPGDFSYIAVARNKLMEICVESLNEDGIDLSQYNTINNARDVAALAEALGYESYNLYGLSYGTKLGLEVIRQNPPGLRSVILDSVASPDIKMYERMAEANEVAFLNIYDMCLADEACADAYPDLPERLNALFAQLDEESISLDNGLAIDSKSLASQLNAFSNSAVGVYQVPYIPRLIHELEQGVTDTWMALQFGALEPQETAVTFKSQSSDMPYNANQLLNEANNLANQADALDKSAESIAEQALELINDADTTPAGLFLRTLAERRDHPYNAFDEHDYSADYVALPLQEAKTAVLEAFVNKHFSGTDAAILLDLVNQMTEEDIEDLYDRIRTNRRASNEIFERSFGLRLYVCNDDVPFNTVEVIDAYTENYTIPGLAKDEIEGVVSLLEACESFPTGSVPDSFHEVVTNEGNIPVIVFTGTNDTQTATTWGAQVAEDLAGSQYVSFPNAGHGVIGFSQCAKDIAAAFYDNPEAKVNTACTADLVPRFVLPDEPLPSF